MVRVWRGLFSGYTRYHRQHGQLDADSGMDRSDSYDYQQGERQPYPTGEVMTRRCTFYLSCYLLIISYLLSPTVQTPLLCICLTWSHQAVFESVLFLFLSLFLFDSPIYTYITGVLFFDRHFFSICFTYLLFFFLLLHSLLNIRVLGRTCIIVCVYLSSKIEICYWLFISQIWISPVLGWL